MENSRRIPNRLRKFRKIKGYSQRYVATLLGLKCTSVISRWEKGLSMPSAKNLLRLCLLYNALAEQVYLDLREEFRKEIEGRKKKLPNNSP